MCLNKKHSGRAVRCSCGRNTQGTQQSCTFGLSLKNPVKSFFTTFAFFTE
jgi:hypothetical protein